MMNENEGWMWLASRWHWIKADRRSLCGNVTCLGPVEGNPEVESVLHCRSCEKYLSKHLDEMAASES